MRLVIEPWGELYVIKPGDSVEVVAWANEPDLTFEIHQDVSKLKIFWSGETVEIFRDGQLVEQSPQ
ncbi:hypothetical protein SAMN05216359_105160 [Roseateles sp. YR242]|nr:hypothetical protein SAMN05216359_105160 [Roseateles sp. YR242]